MNFQDRKKQIVSMREGGFSYASIGAKFNISRSRARGIFLDFQKEKVLCEKWPFFALLSNRSRNSLSSRFGQQVFNNPQIVVEAGRRSIFITKNLGQLAMREIEAALVKLGLIKNGQEW